MTQEEKDLLLKDLCSRLSYHPVISGKSGYARNKGKLAVVSTSGVIIMTNGGSLVSYFLDEIKPYLRLISSMTEEEKKEIGELLDASIDIDIDGDITYFGGSDFIPCSDYRIYIDYLISHHFDFRGLIPTGLALEASEGMYNLN